MKTRIRNICTLVFICMMVSTSSWGQICDIIYVSTLGNNGNPGNAALPVATLSEALTRVSGTRTNIRMAGGNYTENTILNILDDVHIDGGYSVAGAIWTKSSAITTTITFSGEETVGNVRHRIGLKADGVANWALHDLTIITTNISNQDPQNRGSSNYALWLNGASNYTISRCNITSGNAANGVAGVNGNPGAQGGSGSQGGTGGCGAGNSNGGVGGSGGSGGAGGSGGPGANGTNGSGGGFGGGGGDDHGSTTSNTSVSQSAGAWNGRRGQGTACGAGGVGGNRSGDGSCGGSGEGSPGATCGGTGANGNDGVTVPSSFTASFYVPSHGTDGTGGTGGIGGSGGGGGGGDDDWIDVGGSGGTGGSGGGGGGEAGTGGTGGGSSFAIMRTNSNVGAVLVDLDLTSGNAGAGGPRGNGGNGGAFRAGVGGHCGCGDGNRGGAGGGGQAGGRGGHGGFGGNGMSAQVSTDGTSSSPSVSIPTFPPFTATFSGCTNSEVEITKGSGTWALQAGSSFINDLTSATSSYNNTSSPAIISFTGTGAQSMVIDATTYENYVYIHTSRALPTFDPGMPTTICEGQTFTMNTPTAGVEYEWVLFEGTNTTGSPVSIYTTQIASFPSPVTGATVNYHLRLRVRNDCCGWSAPVYFDFDVIPTSSGPTVTLDTVCAGESATISTTGSGTLNWFSDPLGQVTIATGPAPTLTLNTPILNQNTVFYAAQSVGACVGPLTSAEVIVNQLPNQPSTNAVNVCAGEDVILTATGSGTGDLVFYDNALTEIGRTTMSVGTPNATLNVGALAAGSHTYYVREDNSTCESPFTLIGVTVNALPAAPTAAGATICSGNSATLTATGTGAISWYSDATLTNLVGTGSTYNTGILTSTTNYYITQEDANNCESPSMMVTVTVDPLPADPVGTGATICAGMTATLTATGAGGTLNWYSDAGATTMVGTGASFTTPALTQNTTYYVQETNGTTNCQSNIVAVNVTVNALPATPNAATPVSVCAGQDAILTATGSGTGDLVFYDNTPTEVGRVTMGGNPTGTFNAGALAAGNYTYTVREDDGNCLSNPIAIAVDVNALPTAPTAAGTTICSGNSATLTATVTGTANWYSDAALNNLIATGSTYNTGNLTTTTNYYVTQVDGNNCESPSTMVTVTIDPLPADPVGTGATICAGMTATLTATGAGGTLNWYSDAGATNMVGTGASFTTPALTQNTTYYVQETNGTTNCQSNVVAVNVTVNALPATPNAATPVSVCAGQDAILTATGSGTGDLVFYDNTPTEVGRVTMGGNPTGTFNAGALAAGNYTYTVREDNGNCLSNPLAIAVDVNALPAAPTAAGMTICSGNSVTLTATVTGTANWYSDAALNNLIATGSAYNTGNLTTTTNYYVTQVDGNNCESPATMVTVTVDPLPANPTATPDTICAGQTATLTSTGAGGTLNWYSDANATNMVGTGASFTTTALTQNTTFYVQEVSAANCNSGLTAVTVIVNPPLNTPVTSAVMVCEGEDVILVATGSGAGDLVFYDNTNTEIGRIAMTPTSPTASLNIGSLAVGGHSYSVTEDNGTCQSVSVAIGVTVFAQPAAPNVAGTTICGGETATLSATGNVSWYSDGALTNLIANSNSITTSALTANTDYYVVVTDANGCMSETDTVTVTVDPLPAAPTTMPDTVCEGSPATLTATGTGGTLTWYSDATGTNVVGTGGTLNLAVINQTTTYYVRETNGTTGCMSAMATATVVVNLLPNPPSASDISVCNGSDVILSATGSGSGDLVFYDNSNTEIARVTMSPGNTTGTHNLGALAVGNYVYFVREDAGNCESILQSINVEVRDLPAAPSAFNDSPVCEGETVFLQASTVTGATYNWTGPNGFSTTLQNFSIPNITAAQAGNYDVAVTLNGCTSTPASTTVTVNPRPVLTGPLTSNSPLCELDNLTINGPALTGVTYAWTGPNGFTSNTQDVNISNVLENDHQGFYNLVVTDNATNCASLPLSTLVMITGLPNAGLATNNSPVCPGETVTLEVLDVFGASYSWSGPNGFTSTNRTPSIAPTVADTGTYTVTVTVNNCSSTYTTYVNVHPSPTITAIPDTQTTVGTPIQLWATGGLAYEWSPATNLDNPSLPTPTFTAAAPGTYTYVVTTYNVQGCSDQDRVNVVVNPVSVNDLKIVDLFTPNGDGVNDTWPVNFLQQTSVGPYTLQVITRGGMEVLNTSNYQNDWDGTYQGKELPDGTYWYLIHLENDNTTIKGAVTIKR